MKKIISLFFGALIALTLILPCVADEATTDVVTEITTDIVADLVAEDTPVEGDTEPVESDTATEGVVAPVEGENAADGEISAPTGGEDEAAHISVDEWENFKAKITDTATWTMIGAALMTILTTVGTVKSKFDKISCLMSNKADNDAIKEALRNTEKELSATYNANHKEIAKAMKKFEEAQKNTAENEQRLYAILTLFMTNCKISESAKAEILNILADVKKYDGDIIEVVAQAQEAIDEAVKEAEDQAPPTPTLDKMLEEDYMDLG